MDSLPADYVPELRPRPPWLMEEMVASEPALVRDILGDAGQASAIAKQIRRALEERLPVAVVGCGTSETAAMAVADLLCERMVVMGSSSALIQPRQAFEAALNPWAGGLCIGISHEGGTRATILAMDAARGAGAATALLTARPEAPAAKSADRVFATPRIDRSWCHTVGYLSPILAGTAIADALSPSGLDANDVERLTRDALQLRNDAKKVAHGLRTVDRIIVIASGPDRSPAKELALKIEEGARVPARMLELETLLHGHLAAADQRTGLVLIATDRSDRAIGRAGLAVRAAQRIGLPVAAILTPDVSDRLAEDVFDAGRIVLPHESNLLGLIGRFAGTAIALQLLTLELAAIHGTNPDLIRRDQEAYREAAKIAESDTSW
jgi:glutamine---fructose-6-phosphate transaminase (isomerizing)